METASIHANSLYIELEERGTKESTMILWFSLDKHNKAKVKKREDQPMKENKKLETSDTEVMAEIPVQDLIPVTESEEALLK